MEKYMIISIYTDDLIIMANDLTHAYTLMYPLANYKILVVSVLGKSCLIHSQIIPGLLGLYYNLHFHENEKMSLDR